MKPGRVTRSCIVCGIVAVDARHGVRHQLARLGVRHLVHRLEALDEVAAAELLVRAGRPTRGSACTCRAACATCWRSVNVWSSSMYAWPRSSRKSRREGVAGPHGLQPRILLEPRLRDDRSRIGLRRRARHRLAAAVARPLLVDRPLVPVVLQREVLAPDRGILDRVAQLDHAKERVPRFLLALEDVDEQRRSRRPPPGAEQRRRTRMHRARGSSVIGSGIPRVPGRMAALRRTFVRRSSPGHRCPTCQWHRRQSVSCGCPPRTPCRIDGLDDGVVAGPARALGHAPVARGDRGSARGTALT